MTQLPPATRGLRHIALFVQDLEACEHFYVDLIGMRVEWRPDPDNVYLTSGNDNLALHRLPAGQTLGDSQRLDHIGFIMAVPEHVDLWYDHLLSQQIVMKAAPRTHRDGARSFYCQAPDGTIVQFIYHPPISGQ